MSKLITCLLVVAAFTSTVNAQAHVQRQKPSKMIEGQDYMVLERVRLLDTMGFDRPVEAMSVLVPRGWNTEGGVSWKSIAGCRAEIVTWRMSAVSPDGAIRFLVLPVRSFIAFQDQMSQQAAMAAAQQGGCQVSPPFNAAQYLDNLARNVLGGAAIRDIRPDESLRAVIAKISEMTNATAQQYGTGMSQYGSGVYGILDWPDGT